jgi:fibronectin type 3 domain-containing protein
LTASPVTTVSYADRTVASGRTYYYVTTAVDTNNVESSYSNQATAVVPNP